MRRPLNIYWFSHAAAETVTTLLRSNSHNLRYVGIDALARIVRINPKFANEHQVAVIDCLEDPDETLKKKTLELLYKMTKPNNVEVKLGRSCMFLVCLTWSKLVCCQHDARSPSMSTIDGGSSG